MFSFIPSVPCNSRFVGKGASAACMFTCLCWFCTHEEGPLMMVSPTLTVQDPLQKEKASASLRELSRASAPLGEVKHLCLLLKKNTMCFSAFKELAAAYKPKSLIYSIVSSLQNNFLCAVKNRPNTVILTSTVARGDQTARLHIDNPRERTWCYSITC